MDSIARVLGSRALFSIFDAGTSSAGNLTVSIIAARTLPVSEFGYFAAIFAGLILISGACRSGLVDAFTLKWSATELRERQQTGRRVLGAAVLVGIGGLLVGLAGAFVAHVLGSGATTVALVAAISVPLLLVQESSRWICYVLDQYGIALLNTAIWTIGAAALSILYVGYMGVETSAAGLLLVWSAAAGIAAVVGATFSRVLPHLRGAVSWFSEARYIGSRSLLDFALTQGLSNGVVVLVSFVAGTTVTAILRIAQIPMAFIQVVITGVVALLQPLMVRRVRAGQYRSAIQVSERCLALICTATIALSAVVQLIPAKIMVGALGADWPAAQQLVTVITIGLLGSAVAACFGPLVRAAGGLNFELLCKLVVIPASLALTGILAYLGQSALHAAIGQSVGAVVMGVLIGLQCYRIGRKPAKLRMGEYQ